MGMVWCGVVMVRCDGEVCGLIVCMCVCGCIGGLKRRLRLKEGINE